MLVDGEIIKDGMDMVRYLDRRLQEIAAEEKTVTGIIVSTEVRKALSVACQKVMGQSPNEEETVNRYRGVLLIEDGETKDRIEIVYGPEAVRPIEREVLGNLGRVGRGL